MDILQFLATEHSLNAIKTTPNSVQAPLPCRRRNTGLQSPARKTLGASIQKTSQQ